MQWLRFRVLEMCRQLSSRNLYCTVDFAIVSGHETFSLMVDWLKHLAVHNNGSWCPSDISLAID